MKLLNIKKKGEPIGKVIKVPGWIVRRQRVLARYLATKTQSWSNNKKVSALTLFCFAALSANVYLSWQTVSGRDAKPIVLAERFSVPMIIGPEDEGYHPFFTSPFSAVPNLRRQLDSLWRTSEGRSFKDSLNRNHPGLLDSLYEFELLPTHLK